MKKILLSLVATLLLLPAFAQNQQKYQPSTLKPGDYIINSRVDGSLVVIDGGLRDTGFVNKNMSAIKDRVVGVVAYVSPKGVATVIDIKNCPRKYVFANGESKDHTYPSNRIIPKLWAKDRKDETRIDWRLPTVDEAESINYEAVQHALQRVIDAGREDVERIYAGSDYWTVDYSRPDYPKAYAWYHYKGRIKTHLREPDAKLFVRVIFTYIKVD